MNETGTRARGNSRKRGNGGRKMSNKRGKLNGNEKRQTKRKDGEEEGNRGQPKTTAERNTKSITTGIRHLQIPAMKQKKGRAGERNGGQPRRKPAEQYLRNLTTCIRHQQIPATKNRGREKRKREENYEKTPSGIQRISQ